MDYLKDKALATEVGVFYQSDNDYSAGLYNAFAADVYKRQAFMELNSNESFDPSIEK